MIDFDNVTLAIRSDLSNQLRKLLASDIFKGKVSVQRAYADWRRYPQYIVPLSEASIDLIFAPAFGSNKKNATDIRLAIDATELVFTRPEIGTFILLSGDSDFSSLVLKLKEYGKYVIGVGIRESSSDLLIQNCDEYYSYSELTGLTRQADIEYPHKDPWELVIEAASRMKTDGDVMRSDRLKQVMQELDPSFDEKEAGFSRFSKFVAEAGQRGLLQLTKQQNGQYEIDLGSNANVPPAVEAELSGRQPGPARAPRPRPRERAATGGGLTLAAAFTLLKESLAGLGGLADEMEADRVREDMIGRSGADRDPIFERSRFQRLLRQAHDANLVELTKADDGRYFLKLNPEALVEDRAEPQPESRPAEPEGVEPDGARRHRRGRRGGRGRGRREEPEAPPREPQARDAEEVPAAAEAIPTAAAEAIPTAAPGPALALEPGSSRPNPRFRRGSRGPVRSPGAGEHPAEAAAEAQPPAPSAPAPQITGAARSIRPRGGSRSGGRQQTAGEAAPPPPSPPPPAPESAPAAPIPRARVEPRPEIQEPAADEEVPASGLLKRMTAALQRAVRGQDRPKDT
jgi:uncharacterized protein (TIGR00288 family)